MIFKVRHTVKNFRKIELQQVITILSDRRQCLSEISIKHYNVIHLNQFLYAKQ